MLYLMAYIMSLEFQSVSPTGSKVDKLGLYLLVSLVFIMASMVEFAIALIVHRNYGNAKISNDADNKRTVDIRRISSNNMDVASAILFPFAYILFNIIYWSSF